MKKACALTFLLLSSLLAYSTLVNSTVNSTVNPTANPAANPAANPTFAPVGDVFDATCRIYSKSNIKDDPTVAGSGVVFKDDKTHFWIMTAGHVVLDKKGKKRILSVDFFHSGFRSHKIKAEIMFSIYKPRYNKKGKHLRSTNDLAIIKIKKIDLKKYPHPKPIPLAKKDYDPKAKDVIVSCGSADGAWSTAWRGHISEEFDGGFYFLPIPAPGRSGSGIFDKKSEKIIGILVMTSDTEGTAISHTKIYQLKNE